MKRCLKKIRVVYQRRRRLSKRKNIDTFFELSPIDSAFESENEAFCALDFAFKKKNSRIHNIAITGAYGSGKSSFWESYKKEKYKLSRRKRPFSDKELLEISLAKFSEYREKCASESPKEKQRTIQVNDSSCMDEKEKEEFELERGILQQIIFSVESGDIPKSRIRKIVDFSYWFYWGLGLFFISIYGWKIKDYINFIAKRITDIVDRGVFWGQTKILSVSAEEIFWSIIFLLLPTIVYIIVTINIFSLVRRIPSLCLSKISFKGLDVEFDERRGSLINQNITELIYFFEKSNKKIVVFEDIDRNETNAIFSKLRELNRILNNCPSNKLKNRIKFVYMIRDDILQKYERTKFFDFIVPIVPVLTKDNAADFILRKMVDLKIDLGRKYIKDISVYLSDLRLLKNCKNEYNIYKNVNKEFLKKIDDKQELNQLTCQKIFSLILYKNLYPRDFQNLLKKKGVLYYCLNDLQNDYSKIM